MGILNKLFNFGHNQDDVIQRNHIASENGDIKLIILTESKNKYLHEFFVHKGLYPDEVCYSIEDVTSILIRERCSIRLVIIDQGLGDLYNLSTRDKIQDLLSMLDGVYKKALIFYSKPGIKYDNRTLSSDIVRWEEYDGLIGVINTINSLDEHYAVSQEMADKYLNNTVPPLKTKGERIIQTANVRSAVSKRDIPGILNAHYAAYETQEEESLTQYAV